MAKIMELTHLEAVHHEFLYIYKLVTDKIENLFYLIVEHSDLMKYSKLTKLTHLD